MAFGLAVVKVKQMAKETEMGTWKVLGLELVVGLVTGKALKEIKVGMAEATVMKAVLL